MKTLIITPKSDNDFRFLSELLNKLGFDSKVLYDEDKEDMGLLKSMLEEKNEDYVPESEILSVLKKR